MNQKSGLVTRRIFINGLGLTTAGLYFGVYAYGQSKATTEPSGKMGPKPDPEQPSVEKASIGLNPNVFVHLAPTGLLTIACHRSEMGQGIRSSLPILIADELGADLGQIKIVQGDGNKAYGDQNTDGSNSVRGIYEDMRKVAATARMMLIAAAAARLKVEPEALVAEEHFIVHKASNRKLAFGELAVEAGKLEIPKPDAVKLRPVTELRKIGIRMPLLDGPAYVNGTAVFGADVRVPEMLIAVIARSPVTGGRVNKYNKAAALKVGGVKHVVELPDPKPPYGFQPWGGVAVIADNTWAAMKGRDALQITWKPGKNASYNSGDYRKKLAQSARGKGTVLRDVGNVDTAIKSAASLVEAEYYVPHLPHVSMEPPVALARFDKTDGGRCEIWAPTQNPQAVMTEVARALAIPEERVTVHVTMLGGGFGRKSKADFCSEAALLSKAVGKPVRVQFTRTDDIRHDYYNTVNAQHLTAALDANGHLTAWRQRTAFPPIASTFAPNANLPAAGDLQQGVLDLALGIPNVRAEACKGEAHVRIGWLRSVYNIFHSFAINSFIDEIAHAKKQDPREAMLEIFGPARTLSLKELGIKALPNYGQPLEKHPVDAGRLRAVLERATSLAKWADRAQLKDRALGLAAHRSFNSYTAVVAAASKTKDGKILIDEVWIVADAGLIINPDRVHAQMEGSVINGLSHLLYGGVTHKDGAVEQSNFDGVQLVRMAMAPRAIHVDIMRTDNPPGGVGEPGVPPVAPAAANAIFALTGKRIREFGLGNSGLA